MNSLQVHWALGTSALHFPGSGFESGHGTHNGEHGRFGQRQQIQAEMADKDGQGRRTRAKSWTWTNTADADKGLHGQRRPKRTTMADTDEDV